MIRYRRGMTDDWKPRLRWHKSWPDTPDDFSASLDEANRVRIYLSPQAHLEERWHWIATANHRAAGAGYATTPRDAAREAEEALFKRVDGG
jgi:hypothetical protein